ncbi:right-handed parallel beta-helix repeat-containing protein [Cellulomonas biazotea]|uniref:Right handed beta helix domain-containing protein n=1 Tax=Cellulomonas biazotea TaxID=1709 RepID=A0A402DTU1_9CELL|nr:right-handed parallel beta-helix repeat-containing protein [Cellulomonas biazotea]GCE77534.1 hypothetical protein CBZ_25900 [Cellulomonas biazotea]
MRLRAILTCLVLVGAATAVAAPASAAPPPACGDTLTVDTALTADLTCVGDGLRLAPGVSLDLRGHTLAGPGTGTGVAVSSTGAATVRRGTLTGWGTAVATVDEPYGSTGPLTVRGVTFRGNELALDASGDSGTLLHAKPTTVRSSRFVDNGWGLAAAFGADVAVHGSTFTDNGNGVVADEGHVAVDCSRFARNGQALFLLTSTAEVTGSSFVDDDFGIVLQSDATATVSRSRFTGVGGGLLGGASGNRFEVADSAFVGNDTAVQVYGESGSVVRSTFRANTAAYRANAPSEDGFLLQDNRFRLNGDAIVLLEPDPATSIGGNDVRGSTGWGINAPGATDLGGNVAKNNGSTPQCVGVVCTTP